MQFEVGTFLFIAAIGLAMGLATSLIGFKVRWEFAAWTVLYLLVAMITQLDNLDEFLSFLIGSTVGGLLTGVTQTLLLDRYRANNPWYEGKMPETKAQSWKTSVPFGIIMGIVFGAAIGGAVWGFWILVK